MDIEDYEIELKVFGKCYVCFEKATNEDQIALAMRDFADFFGEKMGIIPKTGKFDSNGQG